MTLNNPSPRRLPAHFQRITASLIALGAVVFFIKRDKPIAPSADSLALVNNSFAVRWPQPSIGRFAPGPAGSNPADSASSVSSSSTPLLDAPVEAGSSSVTPGATMLHIDPARTNRSAFFAPKKPVIDWAIDLSGPMVAAPVVADDHVIVATLGGKLASVSSSGTTRWAIDLGERIYGSPLVFENSIYVGVDAGKNKGKLFAINPQTGAIRWRYEVEGDADTSPVALPGNVKTIVFSAAKATYALRTDGTVVWRYKHKRKVYSSTTLTHDGSIVFGGQDDHITALSAAGDLRWRTNMGSDCDATAVASQAAIFVGCDNGEVASLRSSDGHILWKKQLSGPIRGPLSLTRSGHVLVSTYGPTPSVYALASDDGAELWHYAIRGTGAKEFGIHGAPIEDAAGSLLFGAQDDHLYLLNTEGRLRWSIKLGGDIDNTVILAADRVAYVGCEDGKLYRIVEASE